MFVTSKAVLTEKTLVVMMRRDRTEFAHVDIICHGSFVYLYLSANFNLTHAFIVARADRVCTHCGGIAIADELHMIHECPVLQPLRLQYAALFTPDTNTMRSFFAQRDHMRVFKFWLGLS